MEQLQLQLELGWNPNSWRQVEPSLSTGRNAEVIYSTSDEDCDFGEDCSQQVGSGTGEKSAER